MKLYIRYKDEEFMFVEVDCVCVDKEELLYYQKKESYSDDIDEVEIVKLDGEVIYRDEEIALDFKGAIKSVMTIQDIINEGIEEYLKEKENVK